MKQIVFYETRVGWHGCKTIESRFQYGTGCEIHQPDGETLIVVKSVPCTERNISFAKQIMKESKKAVDRLGYFKRLIELNF